MFWLYVPLVSVVLFIYRTYIVTKRIWKGRLCADDCLGSRKDDVSLLIVVGSGGHTTEILRLVESLGQHYSPRCYIIAQTDKMSRDMVTESESRVTHRSSSQYEIMTIPRSREVAQSYISSIYSTLYSAVFCFPLVFKRCPDLVLCNGPGTCIPVCVAAFVLTWLGVKKVQIVFVESLCRVESLSLSGKILYWFADHLLVQWPSLKEKYPQVEYIGKIV